ncbi:MAG: amidase [Gemmatimonadetes bacterium]|nr:amidase [Gemmatimonadota bacterium]
MTEPLCDLTAIELRNRIARRELSARDVMAAHLARIERTNPDLNAIVTLVAESAMTAAALADERQARDEPLGLLHGLPVAHKDLFDTRGIRTTYGSPLYATQIPAADALIVERLKAAGAISVGKTNTPEWGAGSHTFNPVFGATRNPYDRTKTCGGSSGGSAVALAAGMVPIADGSDMGGSLRNPAAFCNVVGLRPSPGRVPSWPDRLAGLGLGVPGPMARTAADTALMLAAIAGPDPRSPIALEAPGSRFAEPLGRDWHGVRIAWAPRFGGLPYEPEIPAQIEAQRPRFEALGCVVEEAEPNVDEADDVFKTLRAWHFATTHHDAWARHKAELKDTVAWNIERGLALSGPDLGRAELQRTTLYHRVRKFFERYDFLVLPVTQVMPFDIETEYPREIAGVPMTTYIDWMKSCYLISATGCPAISVPAGFGPGGHPIGLQIVGRHRDDFGVLQLAHAFGEART